MQNPEEYPVRSALISVSDKTGIAEFAKELASLGITIISTGGTAKLLRENGIKVSAVSDITDFPEILGGRVKTLHPNIHAGFLAKMDDEEHVSQINSMGIRSIDLAVINLYPFEKTLEKDGASHNELIENIDIGGPGMLRAAAKNYLWTAPVINPDKYADIINYLKDGGKLPVKFREELAAEAFSHTAYYDSLISGYFNKKLEIDMPGIHATPLKLAQSLRYGENPHQKAALYGNFDRIFKQLHGKELSYNNILDIDAASKVILEFNDGPALAIIKHTNPCGAATGGSLSEAYEKAFATDNVSPFGGIISMNREVDIKTAETIHELFTEVLIAPSYTAEALELLSKKKNRRIITADYPRLKGSLSVDYKSVAGGFLAQQADTQLYEESKLKIVTKREPTEEEMRAMLFGWKIVKHVRSNAIVFTTADRTLAIGAGQMSRVDSARIAAEKANLMGLSLKGSALASDAFFPFADGVEQAAEAGATAVIQPGGSVRDEEVIAEADKRGMAMVLTGQRHFRH